ncbi:hypothetical protein [Mycolicibacterium sp. OfavD-34-C]|uniref:hypothetical protein n=1 Tax=Mycolicibacterium sp. OfavD-34-C TaxID=2917746 RepID=UPI001EF733A0|nr:hypothetical protein [Mycolicibacterium sp. OfavD-34-C]MCG7581670.1 hypothetical protein [Mycolicibacterium sp. OfavD-34-C]
MSSFEDRWPEELESSELLPEEVDDEDDDAEELAPLLDDEESSESAAAVQGAANSTAPTPSAAASPPTRPMFWEWARTCMRRWAPSCGVCSRCLPVEPTCDPLESPAEQAG